MSGFVMVPGWFRERKPSGTALIAYVSLASFGTFNPGTGRYEECRPSIPRLAEDAGVSENTMRRGIAECVELGAIEPGRTRRGANGGQLPTVYRVIFGEVSAPPMADPPSKSEPGVVPNLKGGGADSEGNQEGSTQNPSPIEVPFDAEASPNAGKIIAGYIDWLAVLPIPIKLTSPVIARLGKSIKECLKDGIDEGTVKRALVEMAHQGRAGWPSQFPSFVVQVQNRPVSAPPATPRAPQFKNSEEQAIDRRKVRHARAKVLDALMERGADLDQAKAHVEGWADEDFLKAVAPSMAMGYIDGDVIDSEQRPEVES